jgi:hypothetical protein
MEKTEEKESQESISNLPKIKYLVLSGGGSIGFSMYGILRESNKRGCWNIQNIEKIYATSVGTIIAVMISLNYDWDTLDDYLIYRPWQDIFKFDMYSFINSICMYLLLGFLFLSCFLFIVICVIYCFVGYFKKCIIDYSVWGIII